MRHHAMLDGGRRRAWRSVCLALLAAGLLLGGLESGWALFASPEAVPIDRVIANVEARLAADPEDIDALYTLARAHYLAFVNKATLVPAYTVSRDDGGPPERVAIAGRWMTEPGGGNWALEAFLRGRAAELALEEMGLTERSEVPEARRDEYQQRLIDHMTTLREQGWSPDMLGVEQILEHAEQALDAFDAAIERRPDEGLYRLGRASLYEQYVEYRDAVAPTETPRLDAASFELALDDYHAAFTLAVADDRARDQLPLAGLLDLVSYEAGRRYLELAAELEPDPGAAQRQQREEVRAAIEALEQIPQRRITPLVLSLRPVEGLASLIDESASVPFDLDGNDVVEPWTWVRPGAGILTWDPLRRGEVTSGRQLFGNATWWLLFADGYRALDTLDDDRDGYVSGAELDGLAVWFDRNVNGLSEPGEVVPIERLPVQALGTRPDGTEHGALRHGDGLVLDDGRVLPTYDWIARQVGPGRPCGDC